MRLGDHEGVQRLDEEEVVGEKGQALTPGAPARARSAPRRTAPRAETPSRRWEGARRRSSRGQQASQAPLLRPTRGRAGPLLEKSPRSGAAPAPLCPGPGAAPRTCEDGRSTAAIALMWYVDPLY